MTHLDKPSRSVTRLTEGTLGGQFGKDKHRRLAVSLAFGDIIILRPYGTRRSESVLAVDLYSYALRCKANSARMEKVRLAKEKKKQRDDTRRSRRIMRTA